MVEASVKDSLLEAQSALANSRIFDLRCLRVEECDGNLVITGSVSLFYYKQVAQEIVRSICQGVEVINSIQVR